MPSMIDDLRNPAALPDSARSVGVVQTHISIVFLADEFVYKVKKAVNFGFLDFSTLEKRRYYCHQEVELNRRLSKGLYLGVLPVVYDGKTHSLREGEGRIVDYAVRMRRIPEERLMKSVFQRGELTEKDLRRVAEVLADFHLTALRTPEIDRFGRPERFKVNTDENFDQVERYVGKTIRADAFRDLKEWTRRFYETNRPLFLDRIGEGRIRDCHGDLHMEHICLTEDLPIFDCIEFNDRFRYGDTVADIAFLLMDLEYHGGRDFARILWNHYRDRAGEGDVNALLTFYKVYRAFVRGKVNSFRLDDPEIEGSEKEEATRTARKYFELAHGYIA
jgi:aminoglycoside phosphotransferase family enzyme